MLEPKNEGESTEKMSKKSIHGIGEPKSNGFIESRVLEAAAARNERWSGSSNPPITIF